MPIQNNNDKNATCLAECYRLLCKKTCNYIDGKFIGITPEKNYICECLKKNKRILIMERRVGNAKS